MMAPRATRRPHRRLGALLGATAIALGVPIAPAGAADPVITGPTISGDPAVGSTLTAVATYDPATAAAVLEWLRCDATTPDTCITITSGPSASGVASAHPVAPEDAGSRIRARITLADPSGSAISAPTAVVAPAPAPTPTPTPRPTPTPGPPPPPPPPAPPARPPPAPPPPPPPARHPRPRPPPHPNRPPRPRPQRPTPPRRPRRSSPPTRRPPAPPRRGHPPRRCSGRSRSS